MLTMRARARAGIPIAIGVIPFGLVAGVAATEAGMGLGGAVAWSVGVFAGASQLAAIDLLDSGAPALVAAGAALLINLRFLMYSASLAPYLAPQPLGQRLGAAYPLTDQAFGLSIAAYVREPRSSGRERLHFYLGCAALMWTTWQVTTVIGAVVGSTVPESVPLDFSIPLVFLALLIPSVTDRPTVVAAAVAGVGTVLAGELGAGNAALVIGVTAGIVAGAAVDLSRGSDS
jgi:predicted branched-subunit amino acid permease